MPLPLFIISARKSVVRRPSSPVCLRDRSGFHFKIKRKPSVRQLM